MTASLLGTFSFQAAAQPIFSVTFWESVSCEYREIILSDKCHLLLSETVLWCTTYGTQRSFTWSLE
jgi:hypothetical protein